MSDMNTPASNKRPPRQSRTGLTSTGARKAASKSGDRRELSDKLAALHKKNPELPVMISADKDIKYDEVVKAITLANKIGITRVGLATR